MKIALLPVKALGPTHTQSIHTDALIYLLKLDEGVMKEIEIPTGRYAWLQVLRGSV